MATDRFITFERKRPNQTQVDEVIEEFVGEGNPGIKFNQQSCMIEIEGTPVVPKHMQHPDNPERSRTGLSIYRLQRFVEVHATGSRTTRVVDVITRQADPLTCAIADGLQAYITRRLDGTKGLLEPLRQPQDDD